VLQLLTMRQTIEGAAEHFTRARSLPKTVMPSR